MAIALTDTNDSVECYLAEAPGTSPDYICTYVDYTTTGGTFGKQVGTLSSTADTTIVSAPGASTQRVVETICITNRAATAITLTPQVDDNGTEYEFGGFTVNTGEQLVYAQGKWQILSTSQVAGAVMLSDAKTENLCLNGGFENILPGTHTNTIQRNNINSTVVSQFPGWISKTTHASADITITAETTTIFSNQSYFAAKIDVTNASSNPQFYQEWSAGQFLDLKYVMQARGLYLNFAAEVKQSAATASACRLFIYFDGTGTTTVYSSYHGANTNWERLLVSQTIPSNCTTIRFGIQFEDATPDFYIDNCQAETSITPRTVLPFRQRNVVDIRCAIDQTRNPICSATGGASWVDCTATSTAWTPNTHPRPAWATHAIMGHCVRTPTGATGQYHLCRPKGATNWALYYPHSGYTTNAEGGGGTFLIQLGQDAVYQVYNTSNCLHEQFLVGWAGFGL